MKNNSIRFAILLITLISTQTAFADVKIKIRQTMSGQTYENTSYIKGKRERAEQNTGGMQTVNITQCDLKRSLQIMPDSQTFMIDTWEPMKSVEPATTTTKIQTPTEKGGVINSTITTKDTGERKQMFGYTARHLIITTETESTPDSCTPIKVKMQTDGWYIDATFALDCQMEQYKTYNTRTEKSGCQDRYNVKQVGTAKRGYPLYEKMTMFDESGKETYSYVNEVIELSNTTLDAALFDVPAGYREVKNTTELYASMQNQSLSSNSAGRNGSSSMSPSENSDFSNNSSSATSQNVKNMATKNSANSGATTQLGAKKEGTIRVGLAGVKTGSVGEGMNAQELSGAIQNTLSEYLKSPNVEVVPLEAKLPSAIDAEAKTKECDFVIYATVSHKKGGGGGMFGKMMGSTAGAIASQTASTVAYTAASAAGNVKSKDELTLDIKVNATGSGAAALSKQYKVKAKSDGEDIISPLIEQAAQAILDATTKK